MLHTSFQSEIYQSMPKAFRIVHELVLTLLGKTNLEEIAWLICTKIKSECQFENCSIYIADFQQQTLNELVNFEHQSMQGLSKVKPAVVQLGRGSVGKAASLKAPVLRQDTQPEGNCSPNNPANLAELAVPILHDGQVISVIHCWQTGGVSTEQQDILQAVCSLVALQIKTSLDIKRYMDISEHERMEAALKESEKRFKLAVSGTSAGVWDWKNMFEEKQWWSKQFYLLLGYEHHEIEPTLPNFTAMLHPDDKETALLTLEHDIHCKNKVEIEYRLRLKQGQYRWFLGNAVVVKDLYGRPIRMVGTIIDIHDRKLAENQLEVKRLRLEAQNHELEQFAFIASHDLQEPLRTISSFVQLLQRKNARQLDDDGLKYMSYIEQSTSRMRELINGLLDYARISKGKTQQMSQVDLDQMLQAVLADMHSSITDSGAQIELEPLPSLNIYPTEMRLLFQNLISNAIKFSAPGRKPLISIRANPLQQAWQFSVHDNGIGIEAQQFDKIFDLFKRLHNRHEYEGTGIGLSHCKKIVEMHEGRIWLNSTPGQGSTFYFTIPIL